MLAGVAAGTAAHLRQDPLIVRVAFVVLATAVIGIVAYMLLWLTMPVAAEDADEQVTPVPVPPGSPADSASGSGSSSSGSRPPSSSARCPPGSAATSCCRWPWSPAG